MSKLQIVDSDHGTSIPYLRGVLTRSLQDAGLNFGDAYAFSTEVRDDFDGADEVNKETLRTHIIDKLQKKYPDAVLHRYRKDPYYQDSIVVIYDNGERVPFSRGILAARIEICCLHKKKCNAIARFMHNKLTRGGINSITTHNLTALTYQVLLKKADKKVAESYLIWSDFRRSTTPLIILIGGVPCSGKSTISTEIASRLDIIRVQSTDMLREVMRGLIPESLAPALHQSTFNAGAVLSTVSVIDTKKEEIMLEGFHRQAEMVGLACKAVLQRTHNEGVSIILEGVHIRATLVDKLKNYNAIVVQLMLGVLNKKQLKRNIKGRTGETKERRAKRYLDNIDSIWKLQSMLLSESDVEDISIIDNIDKEETIQEAIETIMETVVSSYHKTNKLQQLKEKYTDTNWSSILEESSKFDVVDDQAINSEESKTAIRDVIETIQKPWRRMVKRKRL